MTDVKLNLEYVTPRPNKDGSIRYYFRRRGFPVTRLPDDYKSPDFLEAYNGLLNHKVYNKHAEIGSFAWACDEYQGSTDFIRLGDATKKARSRIIMSMQSELINPKHNQTYADTRFVSFKSKHIEVLRDRKRDVPNASNERLKILNGIFKHAIRNKFVEMNPCTAIEKLSVTTDGHKTATDEHLVQYMEYHKQGPARLAMRLLKATGVRVSDLRLLGLPNLKGSVISFTTVKTRMLVELDIGDDFANELRESGQFIFLHSHNSKPYGSDKSMSQTISKWFSQAGIEEITAHSVRKWLATRMADAGVDEFGLMAWFGWRDSKEAKPYTQAYNRKKAAKKAGLKIGNV